MREAVIIKSFPSGIALRLNAELPFEKLLDEIGYKFSEARNFFGSASVALSIEGRPVNGAEEIRILDAIQENCDLHIICIVERDEEAGSAYAKAVANVEEKVSDDEEGRFFRGDLRDGDTLEMDNSIILLGDVYPGCTVCSGKNIIILGGLYGEAYAGENGCEGAFVAALEMKPERIKIGDFKYRPKSKQSKWRVRPHPKVQPKIAYVMNNRITFDALTKDLLSTF